MFDKTHKEFLELLVALDRAEGKEPDIFLDTLIEPQYIANEKGEPIKIDPDNTGSAIQEINQRFSVAKSKADDEDQRSLYCEVSIKGDNLRLLHVLFDGCPANQAETLTKYLYRIGAFSVNINDRARVNALFLLPHGDSAADWEQEDLACQADLDTLLYLSDELYPEPETTILNDIPSGFTLGGLTPEEFIARHTLDPEKIKPDADFFEQINKSAELFLLRSKPDHGAQRMLVDGLIPNGAITLLAGPQKLGKSTLLTELAVAVTTGREFLGLPIIDEEAACKPVVMLCGEDDINTVHERVELIGGRLDKIFIIDANTSINEALSALDAIDPSVLIIDPLRKYLKGDEDNSGICSDFFDQLESFAHRKNCAVVVAHHIKEKGRRINTIDAVITQVRGSGVITNRPRVLIGMVKAGNDRSRIGIAQTNLPPSCNPIKGARDFYRDAVTLRHTPMEQHQQVAPGQDPDSALDEKVISAVQSLNESGNKVTRTNKRGLFEQGLASLSGYTKRQVQGALERCIQRGAVRVGDDGGLVAG